MKTTTVREARAKLSELLKHAQDERVLITNHGAPVAVIVGVEGRDLTEVFVEYDERLRAKLKSAERGTFTRIEDVRAELGLASPSPRKRRRTPKG